MKNHLLQTCYTTDFPIFHRGRYFVGGVVVAIFGWRMAYLPFLGFASAFFTAGFFLLQLFQKHSNMAETFGRVGFRSVTAFYDTS